MGQEMYTGAVKVWNKGNHFWRQWGGYHKHFPKYVSWLKKNEGWDNFLMAGHSHWFQRMVKEYGDKSCKESGDGHGHLNNGEAVRFTLKTHGANDIQMINCKRLHAGRGGAPDDDGSDDDEVPDQAAGDQKKNEKDDGSDGDEGPADPLPQRPSSPGAGD